MLSQPRSSIVIEDYLFGRTSLAAVHAILIIILQSVEAQTLSSHNSDIPNAGLYVLQVPPFPVVSLGINPVPVDP